MRTLFLIVFAKYLNIERFLERSLKVESTLKSTGESLLDLENSLNCASRLSVTPVFFANYSLIIILIAK